MNIPAFRNNSAKNSPSFGQIVISKATLSSRPNVEGAVKGVIKNVNITADACPVVSKDKCKIKFQDGTEIEYDRVEHVLNIICPNINIQGIINHTGLLLNSAGVLSEGEIIDHTGSMQAMRGVYNAHQHNETDSVTQAPNQKMT